MKKNFFFFSILVLAIELPLFSLFGKEIKLWMLCSLIAPLFILSDFSRKNFTIFCQSRILYLGLLIIFSALLSLINAPVFAFSFNQILVLATILPLAVFWETNFSIFKKETYSALALGMVLSVVYAIFQNWAFDRGFPNFEVMAARPNAFFLEPDWLGFYLALGLVPFLYSLIFSRKLENNLSFFQNRFYLLIFNIFILIGILITVARSSWLALISAFLVLTGIYFLKKLRTTIEGGFFWASRSAILAVAKFLLMVLTAYAFVFLFGLSRFDLPDRFRSIFFREHVITLAFKESTGEKVKINLEEKEEYLSKGYKIVEEYIKDENVSSREEKVLENTSIIKKYPLLGSGPGINQVLTNYQHNANNLFLEWWSGWGLLALTAFLGFLACLVWRATVKILANKTSFALVVAGVAAFSVVNFFNASNLLAFAWFYLAWLSAIVGFSWPFKKNR